jgi:DNA-binding transcriptional ArsR family regulator
MLSNRENQIAPEALARTLRAAAEPLRLRLLGLCVGRPASVSELAWALGESEPNVSRHLKQLASAGLLVRARHGQRVEYAVPAPAPGGLPGASLGPLLLQWLDPADPALREAEARLRAAAARPAPGPRLDDALVAVLGDDLRGDARRRRALARCPWFDLLALLAGEAEELLPFARSAPERAALRRWALAGGWAVRPANATELDAGRRLAPRFDLFFEMVSPPSGDSREPRDAQARLAASVAFARRMLVPSGVAWLAVDYDSLESAAPGESPPAKLRAALAAAGFACQRLFPVEAGGRHLLVARAPSLAAPQSLSRTA